jgi:DHA1 family tetracycline resistance protein-like MFS transporter
MGKQKAVLFFTVFIDMVCFSMIFPVMPYLVKELELSTLSIGLILSIFPLMNFLCSSYWGSLSDRLGRRPVMLWSIAITFCANILLAFSGYGIILFFARLLGGIGSANISVAQAYMSDISSSEDRTKNLGMMGAMFGLGFIVGPYIGSVLKGYSGGGSAIWVGLGAAALNFINYLSATRYLMESNRYRDAAVKRNLNPFVNILKWLDKPVVSQLMFLFFIYVMAFSMMQMTSGFLWKEKYGLTEKEAGLMFVFIGVTSALFQGGLVGLLTKKFNERQMIIGGGIIMGIGLAMIPLPTKENFWVLELVACAFLSLGNACITPPLQSWISKKSPSHTIGQALGANQSFGSLGRVIGPALGTFLYAINMNLPYFVSAAIMILPLVIIVRLKR